MAEPDDKGHDKVVPPEGQPASRSEEAAASAKQDTPTPDTSWAEVLSAMQSAEEAVSRAVQGIAELHNKR
jgi:hypothetical protein